MYHKDKNKKEANVEKLLGWTVLNCFHLCLLFFAALFTSFNVLGGYNVSLHNVNLCMGISKEIKVKMITIDEARINAISIKFDNVYRESVLQFQNFCFACFLVSVTVMVTLGSLVPLLCKIIFGMQQFPEKLMI